MEGKKRIIVSLLFLINMVILVAAVIPHHHHPDSIICMKQDLPVEQSYPHQRHHQHHNPETDPCCNSECLTHFDSPTPSVHTEYGADIVFIAALFIHHLPAPEERQIKNHYIYQNSLHGTDFARPTSLRAPPYPIFV